MNSDEFYEYEDRAYIQPTLSSGEQEKFISNLRDLQTKNNAQIAQQTYNLGTAVPSNLGGLGGGEAYFTSRYQVPQVNEMVNTLKAAAKAQELNDIMTNYQAQLKNQYSQAQRAYNKRQRARAAAGYGGYGSDGSTGGYDTDGGVDQQTTYGDVGIWDAVTFDDDQAFYGLNRLTRNPGESDAEWQERVKQWTVKNALANEVSGGKIRPTFGGGNIVSGKGGQVGGTSGGGSW